MKKWLFFLCIAILIASSQGVGSDTMSTVGAFSLPLRNAGRVTALISANHIQQYAEMTRLQPFYQRNYRNPWLQSNLYQRQLLAERIGNQGRARYGAEHGWIKRLGSTGRGIRQGPDAV